MILKGKCTSNSRNSDHRVKVTVDGICEDVLMQTLNGLYLREDDPVYVYFDEHYLCPLVLGACDGQLEVDNLRDILNSYIDSYNTHIHSEFATLRAFISAVSSAPADPAEFVSIIKPAASAALAALGTGSPTVKLSHVETDQLMFDHGLPI